MTTPAERDAIRAEAFREAAEIVTRGYQGMSTEHRLLLVERATQILARAKEKQS